MYMQNIVDNIQFFHIHILSYTNTSYIEEQIEYWRVLKLQETFP